jgi:hypothetical protein
MKVDADESFIFSQKAADAPGTARNSRGSGLSITSARQRAARPSAVSRSQTMLPRRSSFRYHHECGRFPGRVVLFLRVPHAHTKPISLSEFIEHSRSLQSTNQQKPKQRQPSPIDQRNLCPRAPLDLLDHNKLSIDIERSIRMAFFRIIQPISVRMKGMK